MAQRIPKEVRLAQKEAKKLGHCLCNLKLPCPCPIYNELKKCKCSGVK